MGAIAGPFAPFLSFQDVTQDTLELNGTFYMIENDLGRKNLEGRAKTKLLNRRYVCEIRGKFVTDLTWGFATPDAN